MSNSLKINVIKVGKPGVSYNQRLMCHLLEALNMMYRKRGYHIGKCIKKDEGVKLFINILAGPNGFSSAYYSREGELIIFSIPISEKFAEQVLENYKLVKPEERQLGLIMDIMATQDGSDLVVKLRELKASVDITPYKH